MSLRRISPGTSRFYDPPPPRHQFSTARASPCRFGGARSGPAGRCRCVAGPAARVSVGVSLSGCRRRGVAGPAARASLSLCRRSGGARFGRRVLSDVASRVSLARMSLARVSADAGILRRETQATTRWGQAIAGDAALSAWKCLSFRGSRSATTFAGCRRRFAGRRKRVARAPDCGGVPLSPVAWSVLRSQIQAKRMSDSDALLAQRGPVSQSLTRYLNFRVFGGGSGTSNGELRSRWQRSSGRRVNRAGARARRVPTDRSARRPDRPLHGGGRHPCRHRESPSRNRDRGCPVRHRPVRPRGP